MTKFFSFGAALALVISFSSCSGYQIGNTKPEVYSSVRKIAVPTFKNSTLEPRLAVMVTNAVLKTLQRDGTYQIVDEAHADAVLEGEIETIDRSQLRAARDNQLDTRELLSTMRVSYKVREVGTGVTLGSGTSVESSNIVLAPNFQLSDRQALADVSQRVAVDITSSITEGW